MPGCVGGRVVSGLYCRALRSPALLRCGSAVAGVRRTPSVALAKRVGRARARARVVRRVKPAWLMAVATDSRAGQATRAVMAIWDFRAAHPKALGANR